LLVKDAKPKDAKGVFVDWHLKLWGESLDASAATLLPMPTEEDDNDHAQIGTTTISAATTVATHDPAATEPAAPVPTPADHPDRPSKKPTTTTRESATETDAPSGTKAPQETTSSSSWISWMPVSSSAKAWTYGALGLIIVFCSGLGIYLWLARRRRLRNNPRDDYEFELLDEEETEGLNSGEKGAFAGKKGRRTKGGELYDAFAGGSDDEDEFDDDQEYRDTSTSRRQRRSLDNDQSQHVIGDDDDDDDDDDEVVNEKHGSRLLGGR
jgi:kexin